MTPEHDVAALDAAMIRGDVDDAARFAWRRIRVRLRELEEAERAARADEVTREIATGPR